MYLCREEGELIITANGSGNGSKARRNRGTRNGGRRNGERRKFLVTVFLEAE